MPRTARVADPDPVRPSRSRKLKVVTDEFDEPRGNVDLTREAMSDWSEGQRRCRGRKRHNWGPFTVYEYRDHYEVVEQCSHCRNRRWAPFAPTQWGLRKTDKWKPDYRNNYLLPKGAARITEELQDELVAADILSRKIVEAIDEEN